MNDNEINELAYNKAYAKVMTLNAQLKEARDKMYDVVNRENPSDMAIQLAEAPVHTMSKEIAIYEYYLKLVVNDR